MPFKTAITRIHLWAGLILGVQMILWMAGGVVMSWYPIEQVRGEHNVARNPWPLLDAGTEYLPVRQILAAQENGAYAVALKSFLGRPVYQIARAGAPLLLADAITGAALSPLPEEMAIRVARGDFAGDAPVVSADLLREPNTEYRLETPVWRVRFSDAEDTRIYVSPYTGQVRARRNATWRLYDFFFMLHIMDYQGRKNFNNPLLMATSASGLIFALSGFALVILRLRARRYANDLKRVLKTRVRSRV